MAAMSKPNAEALRRGLYVGAVVADTWDKKQYTIEGFDEDGDPTWGEADGNYAYNCELVIRGNIRERLNRGEARRRFEREGVGFIASREGVVRTRGLEVPEHLFDEALAVLDAHFKGRT